MALRSLQIAAFVSSPDFNTQVNNVVAKTAIYRSSAWANLDDNTRNALGQAAKSPASYGFTPVIVTDNNWMMTYDDWAADPPGADVVIESFVQTHWLLLTGIKEPVEPEPVP